MGDTFAGCIAVKYVGVPLKVPPNGIEMAEHLFGQVLWWRGVLKVFWRAPSTTRIRSFAGGQGFVRSFR